MGHSNEYSCASPSNSLILRLFMKTNGSPAIVMPPSTSLSTIVVSVRTQYS